MAITKIGGLFLAMGTGTKRLVQDLAEARRASSKTGKGMSKSFRSSNKAARQLRTSLSGLQKTVIALAAPTALGAMIKKSLDFAGAIVHAGDKIGITTDALQELRFAAERVGVAQNTLDMGLQRFSRRLAEAQQGTGELKGTLEQYGIAVRDADGRARNFDEVLSDLADTIQGAETDQERLRIAFKSFDSEGAALVNILSKGSSGLEEMRQQARDLGVVMDETLLRNAETAGTELDTLARVLSVNMTTAIASLAPQITELANNFIDGLPGIIAWIQKTAEWLGIIDQNKIEKMEDDLSGLNEQIANMSKQQADLAEKSAEAFPDEPIRQQSQGLIDLKEKRKQLRIEIQAEKDAIDDRNESAKNAGKIDKLNLEQAKNNLKIIQAEKEEAKDKEKLLTEFNTAFAKLTTDSFELERQQLDAMVNAWFEAGASITEANEFWSLKRLEINARELQEKLDTTMQFVNAIGQLGEVMLDRRRSQLQDEFNAEKAKEDQSFESKRQSLIQKFTVQGELTEQGLTQLELLESNHNANLKKLEDQREKDELKAAKQSKWIKGILAAINTAFAVTEQLALGPLGKPVKVGIQGGIQVAAIAVTPLAKGDVLNGPTNLTDNAGNHFKAGEAGAEGVFPLGRTPTGELGVHAIGGNGAQLSMVVNFNGVTDEAYVSRKVVPELEKVIVRGSSKLNKLIKINSLRRI